MVVEDIVLIRRHCVFSVEELALEGEFVVVKGEKTYLNDQLIVWFNQAIN